MATPKKKPEDKLAVGRKTEYREEFCEQLIKHMKRKSFWSFAAKVGVSLQTLSNWCDTHPEFLEAKNIGLAHLLSHDETIAELGALGQLKTLVSEDIDEHEDEYGFVTKKTKRRIYKPTTFSQTYHIFLMKNRYPDLYRDKREIETRDGDLDMSDEQRRARIEELQRKRAEKNGSK